MTPPVPPPAAVQIVHDALCRGGEEQYSHHVTHGDDAEAAVAALTERYAFVDRERLAALEAVAEAARAHVGTCQLMPSEDLAALLVALDAVPAAPPMPAEMAAQAAAHPGGEGLPGTGEADTPDELAARMTARFDARERAADTGGS